jgi:hypothetical protein
VEIQDSLLSSSSPVVDNVLLNFAIDVLMALNNQAKKHIQELRIPS